MNLPIEIVYDILRNTDDNCKYVCKEWNDIMKIHMSRRNELHKQLISAIEHGKVDEVIELITQIDPSARHNQAYITAYKKNNENIMHLLEADIRVANTYLRDLAKHNLTERKTPEYSLPYPIIGIIILCSILGFCSTIVNALNRVKSFIRRK